MKLDKSQFTGCLAGLAIGDAIGTTLEFTQRDRYQHINDMVDGGPFRLEVGQWTDDMSMALCLAQSLVSCGRMDSRDQMERYLRWMTDGYMSSTGRCFDIGNTVLQALNRYKASGNPISGATHERSAGNGSIMRLAPVPMFYASDVKACVQHSGESSITTHGARACVDACRYFGSLIWGALNGVDKRTLTSATWEPWEGAWREYPLCPEINGIKKGSYRNKSREEIKGSVYVVESLEAALWCFFSTDNFKDGVLLAANLGGDADTTAAVFGQLAGAYYGSISFPPHWLKHLAMADTILGLAENMWEHAT